MSQQQTKQAEICTHGNCQELQGESEFCPFHEPLEVRTKDELITYIAELKLEMKDALDYLLDLAEAHYPKYYHSDRIAEVMDFYKKYLD